MYVTSWCFNSALFQSRVSNGGGGGRIRRTAEHLGNGLPQAIQDVGLLKTAAVQPRGRKFHLSKLRNASIPAPDISEGAVGPYGELADPGAR